MRISDLSRQSDTPIPTIKYYLREGLLPSGVPTARNQADYTDGHLLRIRAIRALTKFGRLDLSSVRDLLAAIDDEQLKLPDLYGMVNRALYKSALSPIDTVPDVGGADIDVTHFIEDLGWDVSPISPALGMLTQVVLMLKLLGCDTDIAYFRTHAQAAERVVEAELELLPLDGALSDRAVAVVRSILFEVALVAIRRMAQESWTTGRSREPLPEDGIIESTT